MESSEQNKHVVLRLVEALNAGDVEASTRLAHPDYVDHDAGPHTDVPGLVRDLHRRYAGRRLEPLDIVAEDDRVVVRTRVRGDGGVERQIHIWRLAGGRIVEHWGSPLTDPDGNHPEREEQR